MQHDHAAAAALWRGYAQQLGDHRPVHVSRARLPLVARFAAGLIAGHQRDPPETLSARCAARAMDAAATATSLEYVVVEP